MCPASELLLVSATIGPSRVGFPTSIIVLISTKYVGVSCLVSHLNMQYFVSVYNFTLYLNIKQMSLGNHDSYSDVLGGKGTIFQLNIRFPNLV